MFRLPLSYEFCKNLNKNLDVNLTIHCLSNTKHHGLHGISFSHAKTFNKIDEAIYAILNDNDINQTLYEVIFN